MKRILGLLSVSLVFVQLPINAQSGDYQSNVETYFQQAMDVVRQGQYDLTLYRRAYEKGSHHCDQGVALAGITAAKAAKAKLLSMPGHPHRGQASNTAFWSTFEQESLKLPGECQV